MEITYLSQAKPLNVDKFDGNRSAFRNHLFPNLPLNLAMDLSWVRISTTTKIQREKTNLLELQI